MSVFDASWCLLSPSELPTFMSNSTLKLFTPVIALVSSSIQGQAESTHPVNGMTRFNGKPRALGLPARKAGHKLDWGLYGGHSGVLGQ